MRDRAFGLLLFSGLTAAIAGGCSGDDGGGGDPSTTAGTGAPNAPPPPSTTCAAEVALKPAAPVADARARKAFPIAIDLGDSGGMRGAHPVKVVLSKDGAPVVTLFDEAREAGTIDVEIDPAKTKDLAPGKYTIDAQAECPSDATSAKGATASTPLFLVRLGVTSLDVGDGDGARVELMYHAVDHQQGSAYPISRTTAATVVIPAGEPEIDDKEGKLRAFAKPWDDLETPPVDGAGAVSIEGATLPVSLRVGTKPDLVFRVGKSAAGGDTGLAVQGVPPIRIVVDGTPGADTSTIAAGEKTTVRLATTPVAAIAKNDVAVHWKFEAKTESGEWAEIPGADATATLRIYGVLGNTQGTTAPNLPWVAVVDDATHAINGTASDVNGARGALVKHIYEELSLTYDRAEGASHYTDYAQGFGGGASFSLAHFLKRDFGKIVNCSDCASILSTYANMIGANLHYAIIEANFTLHPIEGIGSTTFGSPFDSGRMGFSYHAVTSGDATKTIDDATLAVDGDADPSTAPYTKELVQGMPGDEYLQRLSGDPAAKYTHVDKTTSIDF
jgi:hypothetical protein